MNFALAQGLAGAGQGLLGYMNEYWKQQSEQKQMLQKAMLQRQLQMDLLRAKQEYAKDNPAYSSFIKTASGDIVGTDKQGNSRTVYQATDADKDVINRQLQAREAAAAVQNAQAGQIAALLAPKTALTEAQADAASARADRLRHPVVRPSTTKPAVPAYLKTPAQLDSIRAGLMKNAFGANWQEDSQPYLSDDELLVAQKAMADGTATKQQQRNVADEIDRRKKLASVDDAMSNYRKMTEEEANKYASPTQSSGLAAPMQQDIDDQSDNFGDFGSLVPTDNPENY